MRLLVPVDTAVDARARSRVDLGKRGWVEVLAAHVDTRSSLLMPVHPCLIPIHTHESCVDNLHLQLINPPS